MIELTDDERALIAGLMEALRGCSALPDHAPDRCPAVQRAALLLYYRGWKGGEDATEAGMNETEPNADTALEAAVAKVYAAHLRVLGGVPFEGVFERPFRRAVPKIIAAYGAERARAAVIAALEDLLEQQGGTRIISMREAVRRKLQEARGQEGGA